MNQYSLMLAAVCCCCCWPLLPRSHRRLAFAGWVGSSWSLDRKRTGALCLGRVKFCLRSLQIGLGAGAGVCLGSIICVICMCVCVCVCVYVTHTMCQSSKSTSRVTASLNGMDAVLTPNGSVATGYLSLCWIIKTNINNLFEPKIFK